MSENDFSPEYKRARKIHAEALQRYHIKVGQYRRREISDNEYLTARAAKVEADKAFDRAFEIEMNGGQESLFDELPHALN